MNVQDYKCIWSCHLRQMTRNAAPGLYAHCIAGPAAGRNGAEAWQPHGSVSWRAAEVPQQWRDSDGSAHVDDLALVVLQQPLGRSLGWFGVSGASSDSDGARTQGGGRDGGSRDSASRDSASNSGRSSTYVEVDVAGYPDDRENGSMWLQQGCRLSLCGTAAERPAPATAAVQQQQGCAQAQAGSLAYHNCKTRGGFSGAPLWLPPQPSAGDGRVGPPVAAQRQAPPQAQPQLAMPGSNGSSNGAVEGVWPAAVAAAMHVAGEERTRRNVDGSVQKQSLGVALVFNDRHASWLREAVQRHAC